VLLALLGLSLLIGCGEKDHHKQVAEVATQAAERQAQQNTEMARLNREVAEGTRRMVEADAEARKEVIVVHQEIQAERATLNQGFEKLEVERKEIAQQRRTESTLVPALKTIGGAVVAIAVVVFCLLLLFGLRKADASDAELNELLIHDLVSEQPRLLSGPSLGPAIENSPVTHDSEPPLLSAAGQATEEATQQGEST
jgi:hypothetical protein